MSNINITGDINADNLNITNKINATGGSILETTTSYNDNTGEREAGIEIGNKDTTGQIIAYITFHDGNNSSNNTQIKSAGNTIKFICNNLYKNGAKIDCIVNSGYVTYGTQGTNGYYQYWYNIYESGKIEVVGEYYTSTDTRITIPFNDFAFKSIMYYAGTQGFVDNGQYTNGGFVQQATQTYINFDSRATSQWWKFHLLEL